MATRLRKEGKTLASLETEVVTCPFVQVPVNVMEDRLFGSVDVKKTLETGETVFTPGLMAAAHRGILYVDDINLLDDDLVTMMLQAVTDGFVEPAAYRRGRMVLTRHGRLVADGIVRSLVD